MPRIVNPDGTVTTWEEHEGPRPEWQPPEPPEEVEPSSEAESEAEPESPSPRRKRS